MINQRVRILFGRFRAVASLCRIRRRVPVVNQLTIVECGAACLSMILNYYGRKATVADCRKNCGVGRDGLSARSIANAARRQGLRVKAYTVEPSSLEYISLPAIAHWEFNHFVVIESWSKRSVGIVDPAVGRRRLTADEFNSSFTGVVLTMDPGPGFTERGNSEGQPWKKYLRSMFGVDGAKRVLAQILAASLLVQLLGLSMPLLTKVVVDVVLPFRIENVMTILGIGMIVFTLAQMLTGYLRSTMLIYLRGRLDSQVMLNFFQHLLKLPFTFFQQRTSGDLLQRLGSNSVIREMLTNQTISVILDGSFVIAYLLLLMTVAPEFGLLVISLGGAQILIMLVTRRRIRNLMQRDLAAKADEQGYLVEAMKGIAMLKASGAEDRAFDRWSDLFFNQLNVSLERGHLSALIETAIGTLRALSPMILLWYGASRVLDGTMTLGAVLALNTLAQSFLAPLTMLVSSGMQLQAVGAHLDRISDVLDAEPEQPLDRAGNIRLSGRMELRNVSFRYDPNAPLVLRDISFAIEAGQKVAVVGATGSGKSTLAMLLLGLYQPTEGEILYDDIPLSQLDYRTVRSQFGVVLQESFMFSGSLRENLALTKPDITLPEMVEVAKIAAIHDDISVMPMGYETMVSEGGGTVSGGQRQRLSIARALAHSPSILILDEATSHLDVQTEAAVDKSLSGLSCTRIVIAHRLSTVRNADLILVMDGGAIVERGSHETLINSDGYYSRLVRAQIEKSSTARPDPGGLWNATLWTGAYTIPNGRSGITGANQFNLGAQSSQPVSADEP